MANFKFYSKKDNKEVFEAKSLTIEDTPKEEGFRVEIDIEGVIHEGILKPKKILK
jgi:hypothetical protein